MISVCFPSPCQNGGECVIQNDVYECVCESGYSGTNCEGKSLEPLCPVHVTQLGYITMHKRITMSLYFKVATYQILGKIILKRRSVRCGFVSQ